MKKYVCDPCGYVYDPAAGDPDNGIAPGTAFEDLPDDFVCPVCGVGKEGYAAVVLYRSQDLLHWDYVGPLFETREMGPVLECPDLFPLEDKWVLCFSRMDEPRCVQFVLGGFDGERFVPENLQRPALGATSTRPKALWTTRAGGFSWAGWPLGSAPWTRMRCAAAA